jgi:hypothetical protein
VIAKQTQRARDFARCTLRIDISRPNLTIQDSLNSTGFRDHDIDVVIRLVVTVADGMSLNLLNSAVNKAVAIKITVGINASTSLNTSSDSRSFHRRTMGRPAPYNLRMPDRPIIFFPTENKDAFSGIVTKQLLVLMSVLYPLSLVHFSLSPFSLAENCKQQTTTTQQLNHQ